ncbi:SLC1 [Sanghuangporus sanghuang]
MSLLSLVKPLAYLSVPIFLLRTASNTSPLARYYVRLGIYLSTVGVCSLWGVFVSIGLSLIGRRYDINWVIARSFYNLASRFLGITVEVEGEEHLSTRPVVLIMNHQSMLDILILGRVFPKQASVTSKKELQWMPLLGQFMTLSGAVFIDRTNNSSAVKSVATAGQAMKERGTSIWVFPEGTRTLSEHSDMLPFKKGSFHLAVQAGVPITSLVCQNYWRLYHKGTFESGLIKVKVLPPVSTAGLTSASVRELVVRVRTQMLETLHDISGDSAVAAPSVEKPIGAVEPSEHVEEAIGLSPPDVSVPSPDRDETPQPPSPAPRTLAVDTSAPHDSRRNGSDGEPKTESDDGMVLVDRPETPSDVARSS